MTEFARRVAATSTAFALVAAGAAWIVAGPSTAEQPPEQRWVWEQNLLDNPGFETGTDGWSAAAGDSSSPLLIKPGISGQGQALRLKAVTAGDVARVDDDQTGLPVAGAGEIYRATANVRGTSVATTGTLVLTAWADGRVVQKASESFTAPAGSWKWLDVALRTQVDSSRLQVSVVSAPLGLKQQIDTDSLSLRHGHWVDVPPAPAATDTASPSSSPPTQEPTPVVSTSEPVPAATVSETVSAATPESSPSASGSETVVPAGLPPVCGTWVLQQASTVAELDRIRPQLLSALATPGVRGLSVRAGWNKIDGDLSLFNRAYDIAEEAGKPLSIRVMAGRHTPARVFAAGAYSYLDAKGETIPKPFADNGTAGNPVFEREYTDLVTTLATWSVTHNVALLHLPWYGHLWAEIDNGSEIQAAPGYSLDAWTTGHLRLLDIGLAASNNTLSVEFPMSGHWGNGSSVATKFHDRITNTVGAWSPRAFLQGNALGMYPFNPTGNRPIYNGGQMYDGNQYDWASVYADAQTRQALYIEVYTSSFTNNTDGTLAQAAKTYPNPCPTNP